MNKPNRPKRRQVSVGMTDEIFEKIEEIAIEIGIPLTAHRPAVVAMAVSELHKKLLGEPRKKK